MPLTRQNNTCPASLPARIPTGFLLNSLWIPNGFLLDSYWIPIGFLLQSYWYWIPIGFLMEYEGKVFCCCFYFAGCMDAGGTCNWNQNEHFKPRPQSTLTPEVISGLPIYKGSTTAFFCCASSLSGHCSWQAIYIIPYNIYNIIQQSNNNLDCWIAGLLECCKDPPAPILPQAPTSRPVAAPIANISLVFSESGLCSWVSAILGIWMESEWNPTWIQWCPGTNAATGHPNPEPAKSKHPWLH